MKALLITTSLLFGIVSSKSTFKKTIPIILGLQKEIIIENNTPFTKDVAIVDNLNFIVSKVKIGSYDTAEISVNVIGDIRVLYKETYEVQYQYQAYKSSSWLEKYIIED